MLFTISTGGLMKALRVKSFPITMAPFKLLTKKKNNVKKIVHQALKMSKRFKKFSEII